MSAYREPWLAIDPKGGWSGTAASDAFTVVIGRREILDPGEGRFAAARVHPDLALACCQARAVSAFYHRLQYPHGSWFDTQFLRALALSGDDPRAQQRPPPVRLGRDRDLALLAAGFETGFWDDAGVPAPWPETDLDHPART